MTTIRDKSTTRLEDDMQYCIQCTDRASGQIGDFVHAGDFIAISPVFPSLTELYLWMRANGYKCEPWSYQVRIL